MANHNKWLRIIQSKEEDSYLKSCKESTLSSRHSLRIKPPNLAETSRNTHRPSISSSLQATLSAQGIYRMPIRGVQMFSQVMISTLQLQGYLPLRRIELPTTSPNYNLPSDSPTTTDSTPRILSNSNKALSMLQSSKARCESPQLALDSANSSIKSRTSLTRSCQWLSVWIPKLKMKMYLVGTLLWTSLKHLPREVWIKVIYLNQLKT